jgi:hypothetical protein
MTNHNLTHVEVESVTQIARISVDVLSALLVPTIAIVGVFIAYQQYQINKQRLRHETYERRLAVYKTVQRYLSIIMRDRQTNYKNALKFSIEASEATFLFDNSVQKLVDEIYKKSVMMIAIHETMYPSDGEQGLPVGKERNIASEQYSILFEWHTSQLEESRIFFARKLGLKT